MLLSLTIYTVYIVYYTWWAALLLIYDNDIQSVLHMLAAGLEVQWRFGRGSSDRECRLNLSPGSSGEEGEEERNLNFHVFFLRYNGVKFWKAPCLRRGVLAWGSSARHCDEDWRTRRRRGSKSRRGRRRRRRKKRRRGMWWRLKKKKIEERQPIIFWCCWQA